VLPTRAAIAFVTADAVSGKINLNPFKFHHHDVHSITFYLNGERFPYQDNPIDIANGIYVTSYIDLQKYGNCDIHSPHTVNISPNEFRNGYTIFTYSFVPETISDADIRTERQFGNLRLDITFKSNTSQNLNAILFLELPGRLYINHGREIQISNLGRF
jgi:hypothetical protein